MCYSRLAVYAYVPNFVSISLFCRPLAAKTPNFGHILPYFGLRHLVVSPIGYILKKLNMGAQPRTFPYRTVSKIMSVVQRLHGEIGRRNSDVQKRDEQTDKQTDKQTNRQTDKKNSTFLATPAAGEIRASPNLAW